MITIGKKVLGLLLLVLIAAVPLGCLSINKAPDNQSKTDVNVGGQHGVTVEHGSNTPSNQPKTEVNVGGPHGVTVEHRSDTPNN